MAKYTESKKQSNRKWDSSNLDRMSLAVPKGHKDAIKAHAIKYDNGSVNAFIKRAIDETMVRDRREDK